MKRISILGSTGSVGCSTLDVVDRFPERLGVHALAAGRNSIKLLNQVRRYKPKSVALGEAEPNRELRILCKEIGNDLYHGPDAVAHLAALPEADIVVTALTGAAGLMPTFAAISAGKRIALANKEAVVMAGRLLMKQAQKHRAEILPVDSEHNAIYQCLSGQATGSVRRVLLCSSGGPFLGRPTGDLASVTVQEALNHPRWRMGKKISIDSATMMNKGLETIEARWLFDLEPEQIFVVIHPQAVVHSLVEFEDGSMMAQLSRTDMRVPIQYCLSYPERWPDSGAGLELASVSPLEFFEPDSRKFPALRLAEEALIAGGTMPAVLNAADEIAVKAFLERKIAFPNLMRVVEAVMARHSTTEYAEPRDIIEVDRWAREQANRETCKLA